MKNQLAKLVEVKTLITLGIVGSIIYLAVTGKIEPERMEFFGGIILTYFFTKDKQPDKATQNRRAGDV